MLYRVKKVEYLDGYRLKLKFTNGSIRIEAFMQKKINKVTKKALKQSKAGKNVKKFENLDQLFDDLGI